MNQRTTEQTRLLHTSHERKKDYDFDSQLQQQQLLPLIHRSIQSIPVLSRGSSSSTTTRYNYNTLSKDNAIDDYGEIELKSNISVDEFAVYHDIHNPMQRVSNGQYLHDYNPSTKTLRTGRQRKKTASRTKGAR